MRLEFDPGLEKLAASEWRARVEDIAEEHGNFTPLDDDHFAAFLDAGPKLLVTFENADSIRRINPGSEPRGFAMTRTEGWSHLAIISEDESWFRSPAIYRYFDRLTDDGFFEDFDQVLFHGTGAAGYAASAFCVSSPGCNVLALRPQATLDPRITGWDTRYTQHRRLDFTDRYGFAPDMIDAANKVFVAFDPMQRLDASHAAIFTKSNVTLLRYAGLGGRMDQALDMIGVLDDMLLSAMDGQITEEQYTQALRSRRTNHGYMRFLYTRMVRSDHPVMAANVCAYVLKRSDNEFFGKLLQELRDQGVEPSRPFTPNAA